ncbi:MAG TPA: trypsin-like peptidase domain-containing protein [Trebonia sp.]|nr:trypsin-like peptidase domain-containing protein [Trebonia sp.]
MTSHPPGARGRALIPLLVVLLGVALGAGGVMLLRSSGTSSTPGAAGPAQPPVPARAGHDAVRPLGNQVIYQRVEPSVVDVTSTLRYDAETASGTGFVIDGRAALVLTNNHVIRDATTVTVRLTATGRTYQARIVGTDAGADIAVLQLEGATGLTAAPIGDSATVRPGTAVLAIGNQAGQGGSPAAQPGVISNLGRTIQAADGTSGFTETLHGMIQTTALIEPGDSGGPLADSAGMVIGMDTAAGTGPQSVGYAIPIDAAMAVERQIAAGHRAPGITIGVSGFLGVVVPSTAASGPRQQAQQEQGTGTGGGGSLSPQGCVDMESESGVPATIAPARSGALVDGVLCGTGAAVAGIRPGDVITAAAGQPVNSPDALTVIMSNSRPGTLVPVTWVAVTGTTRTSLIRLEVAPAA